MSTENEPLTPAEARDHEAKIRRTLAIGLGILVTVTVLAIIVVMEGRYRADLERPEPSAALDAEFGDTVMALTPLPGGVETIRIETRGGGEPRYEVRLLDGDGDPVFEMARSARTAGLRDHGARAGDPIRYRIEMAVHDDGRVDGRYRPDRSVSVDRYRDVAVAVLQEALMSWHMRDAYPLDEPREVSQEVIQQQWRDALD